MSFSLTGWIGKECVQCNQVLDGKVLKTPAGWYVGTWCTNCGPYSRESGYFSSKEEAQEALERGDYATH